MFYWDLTLRQPSPVVTHSFNSTSLTQDPEKETKRQNIPDVRNRFHWILKPVYAAKPSTAIYSVCAERALDLISRRILIIRVAAEDWSAISFLEIWMFTLCAWLFARFANLSKSSLKS